MSKIFSDRSAAGKLLSEKLREFANRPDVIVLALPRGGVPVAYEIAKALNAPLDVITVRKLGVPGQEELAMGAIASGGVIVMNNDMLPYLSISDKEIGEIIERERAELKRREMLYRGKRPAPSIQGKTVILVDDGIATGMTLQATIEVIKQQHPASLIIAVPVAAGTSCAEFNEPANQQICICLETPEPFLAVGQWYQNFDQTTDDVVIRLLSKSLIKETTPVPR